MILLTLNLSQQAAKPDVKDNKIVWEWAYVHYGDGKMRSPAFKYPLVIN